MMKLIVFLLFLNLQTILALSRHEICSMELQKGQCHGRNSNRWYFNKAKQTCEQFVYTGCGGNANSFATERQCLGTCGNICKIPAFRGFCPVRMRRFYFNLTSGTCESFKFGGCGGNENSFWTFNECLSVCKNECTLTLDSGLCRAKRKTRYFYNTVTGNCEIFYYNGCGGNGNNFQNKEDCESRCRVNLALKRV